jgi:hypothetical protein
MLRDPEVIRAEIERLTAQVRTRQLREIRKQIQEGKRGKR